MTCSGACSSARVSSSTVKRPADFKTTCQAFADAMEESFAGGVKGSDHIPSRAELQRNISSASLFLYQGAGPLLCHMLPALLSTLNLDKCQCAVLLDRAENEVSERRQNKLDTSILPSIIQLRDAWATAGLLSLRGVNAVLLNQWSMDAARNHAAGVAILSSGLLAGEMLGKAHAAAGVRLLEEYQRLVTEVQDAEARVALLQESRRAGLEVEAQREAAAAERAERVEQERAAAEERGEEFDEAAAGGGDDEGGGEDLDLPGEDDVAAAEAKLAELVEKRDAADEGMRGVEGALALALYGLPSLSC